MLTEAAPAKINLFLHITGRRTDGYHTIQSLAVFADEADTLSVQPADSLSLQVIGEFSQSLAGEKHNLVLRAAHALRDRYGLRQGAAITLEKRLPIGAGLGGGSADAACCFRLLSRLWNVELDASLAASLGSDVPVCLHSAPRWMEETGQRLSHAKVPALSMVLIYPASPLSTHGMYARITPPYRAAMPLPDTFHSPQAFITWLRDQHNDFEPHAVAAAPEVGKVLALLRAQKGCELARLSGSGSACFGLFHTLSEAREAASSISSFAPHWWVRYTQSHAY